MSSDQISRARRRLRPFGACVLLLTAACGARTGLVDRQADAGAASDGEKTACPARLRPAGPSRTIFAAASYSSGRVVVRGDGFDFLARRSEPRLQAVARRGRVVGGELTLTTDVVTLAAGGSGLAASVAGDRLFICHTTYNGDPIRWGAYRGTYERLDERQLFGDGASCTGIAYRGGRGMGAAHKKPATGSGLSRAIVFDVDLRGAVVGAERPALPAGDLAFAALTAYSAGFAWVGYAQSIGSMQATFRRDAAAERTVTLPSDYLSSTVPRMAAYSQRRVVMSWKTADAAARVAMVDDDGRVHVDYAIERPSHRWLSDVSVAETTCGLAIAYSQCPHQGPGSAYIVLLDADGSVRDSVSFAACSPVRLAVRDDHLVAMWKRESSYDATVFRMVPTGR